MKEVRCALKDKDCAIERPKRLLEMPDASPSMFINDISHLFSHMVRRENERRGISESYRKVLMFLSHDDGVSQLTLVQKTRLTAPTISVALAKMESEGLVERRCDDEDMRRMKVYITEKGRAVDDSMRARCREVEQIMQAGLTEQELERLTAALRKILENMIESEENK